MFNKEEIEALGVPVQRIMELEAKARSLANEFTNDFDYDCVRLVQGELEGLSQKETALLMVLFGARVGTETAFTIARMLVNVANEMDRSYSLAGTLLDKGEGGHFDA